ncbi:hypothetical protein LCGC14_2541290 [marine sediment metagenome]|uniref:Uncharacterized protein n=1 Tax=marine sediment metagenome TaxID=412755 RepID=A0A0F9D265_9ZZZZ
MATTQLLIGAADGPTLYRIGQIGLDTGNKDAGTDVYTAILETERQYPAGRDALIHFRRVIVRLARNAVATITMKVFVDEVQTQYYLSGVLTDQAIVFVLTGGGEREDVIEADINAVGTSIRVLLEIDSDDLGGILLIEPIEAHGRVVRPAKSRAAQVT